MDIINLAYNYILTLMITGCILVLIFENPIHVLLTLIGVFLAGCFLLIMLHLPYFALLFLIVYVGAIVVLFLFVIMMLDIKIKEGNMRYLKYVDIFSSRYFLVPLSVYYIFWLIILTIDDTVWLFIEMIWELDTTMAEMNRYTDYSLNLQEADVLRAIGVVMFTEAKITVIIIGLILLLSMVGAIHLTIEPQKRTVKEQNSNNQALKTAMYSVRRIY